MLYSRKKAMSIYSTAFREREVFMQIKGNREHVSLLIIVLAGLCGGTMEMLWVTLYSNLTGISAVEVARQITASVLPVMAAGALAPVTGVLIHMLLSVALGAIFAWAAWHFFLHQLGAEAIMMVALATLALVWATNFFVILPLLNPAFVTLMPYSVTLVSKILFAIAMAGVLQYNAADCFEPKESKQPFLDNPLNHTLER